MLESDGVILISIPKALTLKAIFTTYQNHSMLPHDLIELAEEGQVNLSRTSKKIADELLEMESKTALLKTIASLDNDDHIIEVSPDVSISDVEVMVRKIKQMDRQGV